MIWAFALKNWRIIGLAMGLLIVGWWHQHAVTMAYRQGTTDGERSALQEAAAKVESDTAAARKALDDRKLLLDMQSSQLAGERAALASTRAGINAALSASLNQISAQTLDIKNEIQDLPDTAINDRFRLALQRARDSERERAAQH